MTIEDLNCLYIKGTDIQLKDLGRMIHVANSRDLPERLHITVVSTENSKFLISLKPFLLNLKVSDKREVRTQDCGDTFDYGPPSLELKFEIHEESLVKEPGIETLSKLLYK